MRSEGSVATGLLGTAFPSLLLSEEGVIATADGVMHFPLPPIVNNCYIV